MPRFVNMLNNGLTKHGHQVQVFQPEPVAYKLPSPSFFKKWLGYIDQFILFPAYVKKQLAHLPNNTLFVFTDHALGPWVPLVKGRFAVVHCHDFLAQLSSEGRISENRTGFTGRLYQRYIRNGYRQGQNFISVSNKTREDLHAFLGFVPRLSTVIYNGLNQVCEVTPTLNARQALAKKINLSVQDGYLLHVGGNDWYKNRIGVIEIYNAWRKVSKVTLPLILIGTPPNNSVLEVYHQSAYKNYIHFITGLEDKYVRLAYSGAVALLFPSLAEGFGWPIAEAMACGCLVITTDEPPMNEVAADAALLIPRKTDANIDKWISAGVSAIDEIINLPGQQRQQAVEKGLLNAQRFNTQKAIDAIEEIYESIVVDATHKTPNHQPGQRKVSVSR